MKEDIEQLKLLVESKFGRRIKTKKDANDLIIHIQSFTGYPLGLTTVRRFFGLIRNDSRFNRSTLNILSNYAGYPDVDQINKSKTNNSGDRGHSLLTAIASKQLINLMILPSENIDVEDLEWIKELILLYSNSHTEFKEIAKYFFSSDGVWTPNYLDLYRYQLTQIIAEITYRFSIEEQLEIFKDILSCKYGKSFVHLHPRVTKERTCFFEGLVDYYNPNSKSEELFFKCMQGYKTVLDKNSKFPESTYRFVTEQSLNGVHVLLKGRVVAIQLYYFLERNQSIYESSILSNLKREYMGIDSKKDDYKLNQQLLLLFPLQALSFYKKWDVVAELFDYLNYKEPIISDYWVHNANNHFKMYLAIKNMLEGKKSKAQALINSVAPQLFPKFEYDFQIKTYQDVRAYILGA